MAKEAIDLLLSAAHIIPVEPNNTVLKDHAIAIREGIIVEVLPKAEAFSKYDASETRDLGQHILIPGLINAHTHSAMTLMRGMADDKPLHDWLTQDVWPAEGEFVSPDFVHDGMKLAAAEYIRGGTTCINDMYFFPLASCKALEEIGMRASVGMTVIEFPSNYTKDADDCFVKGKELLDKYGKNEHELIRVTVAPHAPYTVSDKSLERAKAVADEYNIQVTTHLHETGVECNHSEQQVENSMSRHLSDQHCRPLANFKRLGLLNEKLVAVHMTQLTDDEVQHVVDTGTHVVHCPSSNLKLGSGIARVSDLLSKGGNVALGTDGATSNNSLDLMGEMKLAALLAKGKTLETTNVTASEALRMATLNGAKALGRGHELGSIEAGKKADLVAIRCDSLEMLPMYNPISHVVYVAGREHVSDVWIHGKNVLKERQLQTADEEEIKKSVLEWNEKVRKFHDILEERKN